MNNEKFFLNIFAIAIVFVFFAPQAASASLSATMNQIAYVWGDSMEITGTISGSDSSSVSAVIRNSTGAVISVSSSSSGGSPNKFTLSSQINNSVSQGLYNITISSGSDSINMSIAILSEKITMDSYLINSGDAGSVINISTTNLITADNAGAFGGNFSELLSNTISQSGTIHYGNYTIAGKVYHFVLVDQINRSTYDRLYIDDDKNFALYNDSEDTIDQPDVEYQALKKSSKFSNGTFTYIVGEMERATGNMVILWEPASGKTTYNQGDNVTFVVLTENTTNMVSEPVKIEIYNSTGQNVTAASYVNSSGAGWVNFTLDTLAEDLPAGTYTIKVNDTLDTLAFSIESFKMFATVTDTSDNPAYSFAPNSDVRVMVTSKNASGPFNLTNFTAILYYPDGTTLTKSKADFSFVSDGIYTYDYDSALNSGTGRYGISVSGTDAEGSSQTTATGFEVQSVGFEAQAINLQYIEDAESGGAMVNAFPPNKNVTIMTFLTNITEGGKTAKGAGGAMQGLVTPSNCNSSITMSLKDENGASYSVDYRVMNVSDAMSYLGVQNSPPREMLSQCMVIFIAPNKTGGIYGAEIKMKYGSEEKYAGVNFGVQRFFARGSTVDYKGDDFSYLAPNSTVRIKLKVTDLLTDAEVDAANITSGKIIGLYQVFPSFKDVLGNSTLRDTLSENITNGTITFISPNSEGFYSMKFRFVATGADGHTETGIGDAFFMLKKYMVWGQISGAQQGQWYVKQGQNITLSVTVMDIDKGQTYFGGYNSQKTCTGCTGFVINASEIRNDQQFKVISGSEYSIYTGTIINSTNPTVNLTIDPAGNMQSGWYSVDIVITDPATNATYFGWAGFEIRNFWVDMQRAYWNATTQQYKYNDMMGGGMSGETYGVNSDVEFVVIPREPNTPNILTPTTTPVVDNVMSSENWPPVAIAGYSANVSWKNVSVCRVMGGGGQNPVCSESMFAYVVNISGLPSKQASYMANVRININGTIDVGTLRFSTSSYQVNVDYRRDSFPPLFATTENLTINFTGTALSGGEKAGSYNLTNVTIEELFSPKLGRPIKMRFGQNYTTNCSVVDSVRSCRTDVYLSNLLSGEYNARFAVVDSADAEDRKIEEIFFKVQGTIISVPSIEQAWVGQSDSVSKKVDPVSGVMRTDWSSCGRVSEGSSYRFCGQYSNNQGQQGQGQQQSSFNLSVSNGSYTKELFGYMSMSGNDGMFGNSAIQKDPMCMYANGTHLWINSTVSQSNSTLICNLTQTVPIAVGETFTDNQSGVWRLDAISDDSITISGQNSLYDTGALINTSYSRSGKIKFGQIWENNLGAFVRDTSGSGGRKGIDLNGDGYTNGTVYIAISDNATSGVYDTFFFSKNSNFSNPMFVSDTNRTHREFGESADPKNKLTLLSIDPKGQTLKFYSRQVGDWAQLGEIKYGNNVTIPILVTSPAGDDRSEYVSVTGYKNTRNWQLKREALVTNQNITGLGELRFNTSTLGATGDYSFAIETSSDKLDEWKWPMATARGFLVDGELGEVFYASNFKPIPLEWKNWDNGIVNIQSDRRNASEGMIVDGVLSYAQNKDIGSCTIINDTEINLGEIQAFEDTNNGQQYYFFHNKTDLPKKIYMNAIGCTFNVSALGTAYQEGDTLIMNRYGRNYNLTVLRIDQYGSNADWRIDFGVAGINSSLIKPLLNRTGNSLWGVEWAYMQNVSIFNQSYDVLIANDTSNYERCKYERSEGDECAKKAWIVPTSVGNFSQAVNVTSGENFTSDLYLASVGPRGGDGILVGNFSSLGSTPRPSIGSIPLADNSPAYFAVLNESALGYDLDKNGAKTTVFYALAFDSNFNEVPAPTSILIDDDLQLMPFAADNGRIPIDFDQNESYIINSSGNKTAEIQRSLPSGNSDGNVQFDSRENGGNQENSPSWNVPFFNNTHLLLKQSKWNINESQPVDVLLHAFNFDMQDISGANISVRVAKSSYRGFEYLKESDYTLNRTFGATDSEGYELLKITPSSSWQMGGQYQILTTIQTSIGNETFERWFNVGNMPMGGGGGGGN